MGLLRDAVGSALGANQPNNGLGGPKLPWKNSSSYRRDDGPTYQDERWRSYNNQRPRPYDDYAYDEYRYAQDNSDEYPNDKYSRKEYPNDPPSYAMAVGDPSTAQYPREGSTIDRPPAQQQYTGTPPINGRFRETQHSAIDIDHDNRFRPLALPQIGHGDGQPFVRGYNGQLAWYGISDQEFIRVVDAVNVAIIPNPENQIFQKAANIGGFFIPGAGGIGLMAGQVAVGLGSAYGHQSILGRTLSNANLEIFLPRGLEICIMSTDNLNSLVGMSSSRLRYNQYQAGAGASPESRLAGYSGLVTPISTILPPARRGGRNDPIAMIGRGMASRDAQKKVEKATEEAQKGKLKDRDRADVKWLVVKTASPEALAYLAKGREGRGTPQRVEARGYNA